MTINGNVLSRQGSFECIHENLYKPILRSEDNLASECSQLTRNIINKIHNTLGYSTNIAKIQRYDNGNISIKSHSDKIIDLDPYTPIFILCIGEPITALLINKKTRKNIKVKINHKDLLVISYKANLEWTHGIIKEPSIVNKSYSIVFRKSITFLSPFGYVFGSNTPFKTIKDLIDYLPLNQQNYLSKEKQKNEIIKCFSKYNRDNDTNLKDYNTITNNSIYPM